MTEKKSKNSYGDIAVLILGLALVFWANGYFNHKPQANPTATPRPSISAVPVTFTVPRHPDFPPRVNEALVQAEAFWKKPCPVEHVTFEFEPEMVYEYSKGSRVSADGKWIEYTKTIELNIKTWDQDELTYVITHECGHALGHPHEYKDENNIMWPYTKASLKELEPKPKKQETVAYVCQPPTCSPATIGEAGTTLTSGATGTGTWTGGTWYDGQHPVYSLDPDAHYYSTSSDGRLHTWFGKDILDKMTEADK